MKTTQTILKKTLLELVLICGKIKKVDVNGMWYCITCWHYGHRTTMCGWHFIPQAKGNSCKFELDGCNLQCNSCNWRANQWEQYKHWLYIDKEYYPWRAEELHKQSRQLKKWTTQELETEIVKLEMLILNWAKKQNIWQRQILIDYMNKNSERKRKCKYILVNIH